MTTEFSFVKHVIELLSDPHEVRQRLTACDIDRLHCAIGVAGEAGELGDAVKKSIFYNQELDQENVLEEVGDILFYLQGLLCTIGMTFDDAMKHNMEKLAKRYPQGFSFEAAAFRADKQEEYIPPIPEYDAAPFAEF